MKKNILKFLFILFSILLIISIINIIKWKIDSNKTNKQISDLRNNAYKSESSDNAEIIKQVEEIPKSNPYWDYIKMDLINVDFKKLKQKNNDIVGWIKVNGTNINYPFVRTNDNKYYLEHSLDKSYNQAGWVFEDYRNTDTNNKNTILYAHGRLDTTMFGSLKNILQTNWIKNTNNYVVKLSTEYENTLWQVFSVYRIPTTNDYIQTEFTNNDEYNKFLNTIKNRSNYNFNTNINSNDQILTLSTCYNDFDKVVLHAKLIKREKRA